MEYETLTSEQIGKVIRGESIAEDFAAKPEPAKPEAKDAPAELKPAPEKKPEPPADEKKGE